MAIDKVTRFSVFIDLIKNWQLALIALILTFGFAYSYLCASKYPNEGLILPGNENQQVYFGDALYFSIVTEATLGYGDIRPVGFSRGLASLEVILGLMLAGLIVAKITSVQGRQDRILAHKAQGYWIESCIMYNKSFLITFVQISFNQNLRYDGANFNINGDDIGFFTGELFANRGDMLKFLYSNKDSLTTFFDEGIANLSFTSKPNSKVWTNYSATAHDFGKHESTSYEGYRASKEEIEIFLGNDFEKRRILINKYANLSKTSVLSN